jgi:hypothetical protein
LSVSDVERSVRFYMDKIGLAGTVTVEDWGARLRLDDGFMMALIEGDPLPSDVVDRIHFSGVSFLMRTASPNSERDFVPLVSERWTGSRSRGIAR